MVKPVEPVLVPGYGASRTLFFSPDVCQPAGEVAVSAKWDSPAGTSGANLIWPI